MDDWRSKLTALKSRGGGKTSIISPPQSSEANHDNKENVFGFDPATTLWQQQSTKSHTNNVTPAHVTRAKMALASSSSSSSLRAYELASSCTWDTPLARPRPDDEDEQARDSDVTIQDAAEQVHIFRDADSTNSFGGGGVAANLNAINFGGGESIDGSNASSFVNYYADSFVEDSVSASQQQQKLRSSECDTTTSGSFLLAQVHPYNPSQPDDISAEDAAPSTPPGRSSPLSDSLARTLTLSPSFTQQQQLAPQQQAYKDYRDPALALALGGASACAGGAGAGAGGRVVVSPTRSKHDSEFSRRLTESEREKGAEDQESTAVPKNKCTEQSPATPQVTTPQDEWREAVSPQGKVYYYNRRTRESSWRPPANAVVLPRLDAPASVMDAVVVATPSRIPAAAPPGAAPSPATQHAAITAARAPTQAGSSRLMLDDMPSLHCPACGSSFRSLVTAPSAGASDEPESEPEHLRYQQHVTACLGRVLAASSSSSRGSSRGRLLSAVSYLHAAIAVVTAPLKAEAVSIAATNTTSNLNSRTLDESDVLEHSYSSQWAEGGIRQADVEVCPDCGRTFAHGRLSKHLVGCRTITEKRTPTDFSRRRTLGTPMEFTHPASTPTRGTRGHVTPDSTTQQAEDKNRPLISKERPMSSPLGRR